MWHMISICKERTNERASFVRSFLIIPSHICRFGLFFLLWLHDQITSMLQHNLLKCAMYVVRVPSAYQHHLVRNTKDAPNSIETPPTLTAVSHFVSTSNERVSLINYTRYHRWCNTLMITHHFYGKNGLHIGWVCFIKGVSIRVSIRLTFDHFMIEC